ncbi:MAG: hypothetical protein RL594_95 [Bacteroidota bacterium]|jgi:hypothetical protein
MMRRAIIAVGILFWVVAVHLDAQPVVSYILPDIGAPGMGSVLEIVAPATATGSFGSDGTSFNNPGDAVRVECARPSDMSKLTFGPLHVSWSGRLISTVAFVNPEVQPNDHDWTKLRSEFRIPIRVVVNGVASPIDTFYIVKPWPLGSVASLSDRIFGQGALGRRSRRGAMIVDSLVLAASALYQVSTNDCDQSTNGNQGYLPLTLYAIGPIRAPRVADQIATEISVSAAGIRGGPGGGGGAGAYVNLNFSGQAGTDGGDGFTGGGPGGYNFARTKRTPGVGTGAALPQSSTNTTGSPSLNGTRGGESTTSHENAGGGTGHPFGSSGTGCGERTTCQTLGGAGGGSGSQEGRRGGAGGYSTPGETESSFSNGGIEVGNVQLVPLAGGSGGAGGNPDVTRSIAAGGGGGGGAMSIHGRELSNIRLVARGGIPTRQDLQGGCGSGGGVIAGARSRLSFPEDVVVDVDGGFDAAGSAATRHLTGGKGRVRVDGPVRGVAGAWAGVSMEFLDRSQTTVTVRGTKGADGIFVWARTTSGQWTQVVGPSQIFTPADQWTASIPWVSGDSIMYVVAAAEVPNPSSAAFRQQPGVVFSQSAWNVVRRVLVPVLEVDTLRNMGQAQCPGGAVRDTIIVRNPGPDPVRLTGSQIGPLAGFAIDQQPTFPLVLAPFETATFIVSYQVQPGQTGIQRSELRINYNDTYTRIVKLTADATPTMVNYFWRGLRRDTLDIGRVCIGRPLAEQVTIRKTGRPVLTIVSFTSASPAVMSVTGGVPITLRDSISFTQIALTFSAKRVGAQVVPILVRFRECDELDTIFLRHIGVESQINVIGNGQFGDVRLGDRRESVFELRNTGTSDLDITTRPVLPAPFSIVSITPPLPARISPGSSIIIVVAFTPTVVGRSATQMQILADSSLVSCSDSAEILLAGTGITSDIGLSSTSLTYSPVAACDSAQQQVTITNNGKTTFTLLYPPVINGVNASSFTWSGGAQQDTSLRPGASLTYAIQFRGSQGPDGVKSAVFAVRTDDQTIGTISVNLNGQRTSVELLGPRVVDLGSVRVGSSRSVSFSYTNPTLLAIHIVATLVNGGGRVGVNPSQIRIDPGQTRDITYTYLCGAEEDVQDTVLLAIDEPCVDTISVIVRARGGIDQLSASQKLNFGIVSECAKRIDSVIYVNSGAFPIQLIDVVGISGADAAAFRLLNPEVVRAQTLAPGEQRVLRVEFDPSAAADGIKIADVTILAKINDVLVPVICEVKGERRTSLSLNPSSIVFGRVSITSISTQSLVFSNMGTEPLAISSVSLASGPTSAFRVRSNPTTPMTIPPGGTFEVIVDFSPKRQDAYSDGVIITIDQPCPETRVLALSGTGVVIVDVIASLPDLVELPTQRDARIPISAAVSGEATQLDSVSFSMRIRYVSSMFALREVVGGVIHRHETVGGFTVVDLDINNASIASGGSVIAELIGDVTIGPVDSTTLEFERATMRAPNVTARFTTNDGSLVTTLCEAGGKRLITRAGRLRVEVHPNPVGSWSQITTETYERGIHRLILLSLDGGLVSIAQWEHDSTNPVRQHALPFEALVSGVYQLILETPSRRRVLPLSIVR